MHTIIYNYIQLFTIIYSYIQLYTVIYNYIQLYTIIYNYIQLYTYIYIYICTLRETIFCTLLSLSLSLSLSLCHLRGIFRYLLLASNGAQRRAPCCRRSRALPRGLGREVLEKPERQKKGQRCRVWGLGWFRVWGVGVQDLCSPECTTLHWVSSRSWP